MAARDVELCAAPDVVPLVEHEEAPEALSEELELQALRRSPFKGIYFKLLGGALLLGLVVFPASHLLPGSQPSSASEGPHKNALSFMERKAAPNIEEVETAAKDKEMKPMQHNRKDVKSVQSKEGEKVTKVPVKLPDQGMGFPSNTYAPTLFCFSVMNADNIEEIKLIKGQLSYRIGIFACDNVAVLSGRILELGEGHSFPNGSKVMVKTWYNPAAPVPMGNFASGDNTNSFKNTDIFINAWKILLKSKAVFGHDWTVKVDPDAVFFPYRLRWHLQNVSSLYKPLYFKNCNYEGQAALYGSLEIFSQEALKKLDQNMMLCENELDWQHWGEDQWIDTCMWSKLGAMPLNDFKLVGDHRCMDASCEDAWRAAFHDYKAWDQYKQCHDTSMAAEQARREAQKKESSPEFCCTYSWDPSDPCNKCGSKVHLGSGFCGSSKESCMGCGAATWCQQKVGYAVAA